MNPESYFETPPWDYAVTQIQSGLLGPVVAAALHEICAPQTFPERIDYWQYQFQTLLGSPTHCDIQQNSAAVSIILRYPPSVIVRVFLEASPATTGLLNFEFVTTQALLIWKPDIHPLSIEQTTAESHILYEHPYPTTLKPNTT